MANQTMLEFSENEELRRQCSLFRAMFDAVPDRIYLVDSEMKYCYLNATARKGLGLEADEVLGKTWREAGLPTPMAIALEADVRKVLKTGWPVKGETGLSVDGENEYFEYSFTPVRDLSDKASWVLVTIRNITERKNTEEELNDQRILLQTVFESAPEYLFILDRQLNYIYVSPTVLNALRREEMETLNWKELPFPTNSTEPFETKLHEVFNSGKTIYLDTRFLVDGESRYYENVLTPVRTDPDQVEFILVSARDMTMRKWYEKALKETTAVAEKRAGELDTVFSSITDGLIIYDKDGKVTQMNEIARETFGQRDVKADIFLLDGGPLKFSQLPDYIAVQSPDFKNAEMEVVGDSGVPQWLTVSTAPLKSASGEIWGTVLTFKDITERKRAEEALRQSEERLKILIENVVSGMALVDENGKFSLYNSAFLRLFGLQEDQSKIFNLNDLNWGLWQVYADDGTLLHVDDHPVRKAMKTAKPVRNRKVAVKLPSGGDMVWMLISAEPILKPQGGIDMLICTYHEIIERKHLHAI